MWGLGFSLEGHCTPGLLRPPHGRTLTEGALRAKAPKTTNGHALKCQKLAWGTRLIPRCERVPLIPRCGYTFATAFVQCLCMTYANAIDAGTALSMKGNLAHAAIAFIVYTASLRGHGSGNELPDNPASAPTRFV
jgi:hypothetical protein